MKLTQEAGTWTALDAVEALGGPKICAPRWTPRPAREYWDAFPRSAKRWILEWILAAKKPETRERRIGETARLAAEDVRAR